MACNPCCCWRMKDAAVSIGIWSIVCAFASLAMYGWQWAVLSQCQEVTMAQANLQCEYYCPCIFCVIQLGIFGWQMAAIKYEKDRAANTLLPNYNTYGRYDIPSYYESYWQSPEERYYTGLFVIQILCLIASFFLLFASIMLVYGVHTYSRFLVWPWFICMASSILTSLAYCIMWWAGDVRDYWLVLTILQIFAVILNSYCFVVIAVFYKRMLKEIRHYGQKREYDRFSQTPQHTDLGPEEDDGYPPPAWEDDRRWPPAGAAYPPDKYPPDPINYNLPPYGPKPQYYPRPSDKQPFDRYDGAPRDPCSEPIRPSDDRPRSGLAHAQSVPSLFDDFRDVPRQHHRRSHRHRSSCRHCDRHHHHHHRRRSKRRKDDFDACSECSGTESASSHHHHRKRSRSRRRDYSDNESELTSETDRNYDGHKHRHRHDRDAKRGPRQVKRDDRGREQRSAAIQADPDEIAAGGLAHATPSPANLFGSLSSQGITIPQHIVIPPTASDAEDPTQPRKYQINSEIVISYDPRQHADASSAAGGGGNYATTSPLSDRRQPTRRDQPVSITSNV